MEHRCCWCGGRFVRVDSHYWCESAPCRQRQVDHAIAVQDRSGNVHYLYLPLPRQVAFDECKERFMLGGGAAGSTKSHEMRWGMYRRCLKYPDYEALLLRRTWDELNKHHFRLMAKEAKIFQKYGYDVNFSITNREMTFNVDGNLRIIEGGHMEDPEDVEKYLGRERDEIGADEGSTFPPRELLALSTRARTTKPHILADGIRGLFRVYTNPGGPAANALRDFFIDHSPNWEDYPPELKVDYHPDEWVFIPGLLEDNPYLPESYERDLAILSPTRYKQLRHGDWDAMAGAFFDVFSKDTHVKLPEDLGWTDEKMAMNLEMFEAHDWGYMTAGCHGWFYCLPDSRYYVRKDWKFSHLLIDEVKKGIYERRRDLGNPHLRYTVADPAVRGPNTQNARRLGESVLDTFLSSPNPVPMIPGDNDRIGGWQRLREMLQLREDGLPSLIFHPECRYLIRSFSSAVSSKNNPEDINTDTDDHGLDMCRYGAMSRPSPTRITSSRSSRTFKAGQKRIADARRFARMR